MHLIVIRGSLTARYTHMITMLWCIHGKWIVVTECHNFVQLIRASMLIRKIDTCRNGIRKMFIDNA